ncbi:hypothetical protein N7541_006231 [Penicillium brevicompactum]|uniref:Uncharacterized protein n=1 Tax=Penicillium brevicompactum TaxID=5074 RepID=A0A9W9UQL1_PENBR|nr:hypothetical protein N7541_006231 [Penicillium brevicompactum]
MSSHSSGSRGSNKIAELLENNEMYNEIAQKDKGFKGIKEKGIISETGAPKAEKNRVQTVASRDDPTFAPPAAPHTVISSHLSSYSFWASGTCLVSISRGGDATLPDRHFGHDPVLRVCARQEWVAIVCEASTG